MLESAEKAYVRHFRFISALCFKLIWNVFCIKILLVNKKVAWVWFKKNYIFSGSSPVLRLFFPGALCQVRAQVLSTQGPGIKNPLLLSLQKRLRPTEVSWLDLSHTVHLHKVKVRAPLFSALGILFTVPLHLRKGKTKDKRMEWSLHSFLSMPFPL